MGATSKPVNSSLADSSEYVACVFIHEMCVEPRKVQEGKTRLATRTFNRRHASLGPSIQDQHQLTVFETGGRQSRQL